MIELPEDRIIDATLEEETMKVKVVVMNKNKREGVGIMLTTPLLRHFREMGLQWGAFVQFAVFKEGEKPRIAQKVFELVGEEDWNIL